MKKVDGYEYINYASGLATKDCIQESSHREVCHI
jgi:hypothetical protein